MRNLMLLGVLATNVLLAYRIIIMNRTVRSKLARDVVRLHIAAASTMLFYAMTLLKINAVFARAAYGLYFWCSDFLLMFFFIYINDYTQEFRTPKFCRYLIRLLMLGDGIICIANIFNECMFTVGLSQDTLHTGYYRLAERHGIYFYHKIFIYMFAVMIFVLLLTAVVKAASVYVTQYFYVMCCFVFTIASNVMYEFFDFNFDYSVLFYGVIAILIYYLTFSYVPKGLVEKTLAMVARNIDDGVLCMDMNGRCIYANAYATKAFHAEQDKYAFERFYYTWIGDRKAEDIAETSWSAETEIDGEKKIFTVRYKGIRDTDDRFIGCYYILHDETEHRKMFEEERYKNSHDALTGLYNREYFYEEAARMLTENPNIKYSVLCLDIQNFKIVNDVFGVKKGDEVLKSVAEMLLSLATEETICARLSGDRFALFLRDEKINHEVYLEAVNRISRIGEDQSYHLRIYTGICPIHDRKLSVSVSCDRAFLAIETIKGDYQQSIAYYDDDLRKQMLEGQHMVSDFRSAIARSEFRIFLQPQVDHAGTMIGAEALVRWFRPVQGMMVPEEFLPVFEHSGLISTLDQYVWELACRQLVQWKEAGHANYYISVNVSPKDFYFLDIYRTLTMLVESYEVSPENLHLEITEASVMKDAKKHLELMEALRTYGFRIVMDDFGRGFSSLNMLQDMSIDGIKIDMEFLRRNDDPERSRMILEMIINLSQELGISVLTEGVEQPEQLRYMKELGCAMFQGYLFAKPMPVDQFEKLYLEGV